ncbi:MAG TPA: hypothetical protein VN200_09970 [Rhodoglobus sp.]|nr:hypothetical protein [Rhodoglobus sp.]
MRRMLVSAMVLVALSGCAWDDSYPSFQREATQRDRPPDEVRGMIDEQFTDPEIRFEVEYDGADIYLAREKDFAPCLVVADGQDSFMACGGDGVTASGPDGLEFRLVPAPQVERDGWRAISDNVAVRD